MQRNKWLFSYNANTVWAAAEKKYKHHLDRLDWWRAKRDEVMTKIKAEGIEIDDSVAGTDYSKFSNYRAPEVSIRDDLLKDLRECIEKTREHRSKVDRYDAWIEILKSQGQTSLQLDHEDWLFFFSESTIKPNVEDEFDPDDDDLAFA